MNFTSRLFDYFPHVYGDAWQSFKEYLEKLGDVFGFAYLEGEESADEKRSQYYSPNRAEKISQIEEVLSEGEELIKNHYNSDVRVETVSVRLFEHYLDLVEWLGKLFSKKAAADDEGAKAIYPEFMDYFGKKECELERYFNQCFFFNYLNYYIFSNTSKTEFIL